jgi:DNA helicase-2/ATP-dependent DNA helicase PcrA
VTLRLDDRHHTILATDRHALVLGGPGSGKTTLALLKAQARIEAGLALGQAVLFLSFSRAAVARIQDALSKGIPAVKRSLLQVQTFHAFFWEVLQAHGYLLDAPRRLSILPSHEERAMRNGIEPDDNGWAAWEQSRLDLFHQRGRVCFDLFAPLVWDLLMRAQRIRQRIAAKYPLIIVDEAQDTGTYQWKCIRLFADHAQLVCLADLDQLIFDHLPGVGPQRVEDIRTALQPVEIDLGSDNNRSPGTEIAIFAKDVLHGAVRGAAYKNVGRFRFKADAAERDKTIRQSVGFVYKKIRELTGNPAQSVAVIASYSRGVSIISAALRQDKPIPHQVLLDEAFVMLASKIGAFLLEPRAPQPSSDICALLELLSDAYRAKGGKTAIKKAGTLSKWSASLRLGKPPKTKLAAALGDLLQSCSTASHDGKPAADWLRIKRLLRASDTSELQDVAEALDYLIAYNRGQRISASLSDLWIANGHYGGAQRALEDALTQEQLVSPTDSLHGIHVMNIHKCKGKQFDGVVLYRAQHNSPFVWPGDQQPYAKSRKILHVAITRARAFVLIIDEAYSSCPILDPHTL